MNTPCSSSVVARLARSIRVPEGWEVVAGASLDGGWLGPVSFDIAVLAPGPGPASLHRAQLAIVAAGARGEAAVALAAAAHVPECWLVDERRGWTVGLRSPRDGKYRLRSLHYPGEALCPLALPRTAVVPLPCAAAAGAG